MFKIERIILKYFNFDRDPYSVTFGKWYINDRYYGIKKWVILFLINEDLMNEDVDLRVTRHNITRLLDVLFNDWLNSFKTWWDFMLLYKR